MFRITYKQGNGYHCACCRKTYTQHADAATKEEVIAWLSELKACQTISQYEDDNDRTVIEIREIKDELLNLEADDTLVQHIIAERKKAKEEAQKEKQAKQLAHDKEALQVLLERIAKAEKS